MKRILITGTSGALGNNLRKHFIERGYDVIGTVGRSQPRESEVALNLGDWKSYLELEKVIGKIDAVIHTAALLHGKSNIRATYNTNVVGTENILKLSREAGCKNFIQISSVGIYGIRSLGKNRTETTHPFDIEPYGISKRKAEIRVRNSNIPYTILRLPLIKYSGDFYIEKPIKQGKSVFIKKQELNIVSSVTPKYIAKTCECIIENGPLNDTFNCASHHQTWRDMVTDHCKHQNIEIINSKRASVFGAIPMGLVIGAIALFGQHTPSDKLDKTLKKHICP